MCSRSPLLCFNLHPLIQTSPALRQVGDRFRCAQSKFGPNFLVQGHTDICAMLLLQRLACEGHIVAVQRVSDASSIVVTSRLLPQLPVRS